MTGWDVQEKRRKLWKATLEVDDDPEEWKILETALQDAYNFGSKDTVEKICGILREGAEVCANMKTMPTHNHAAAQALLSAITEIKRVFTEKKAKDKL